MRPFVLVNHVWQHHISRLKRGSPYYVARIGILLDASGWNSQAICYACIVRAVTTTKRNLYAPYCINPVDADHPTHITLVLGSMSSITFDFETSTSSLGWRRELTGTLFLYRHQRRTSIDSSNAQPNSVRISCPLDRIDLINSDPLVDVLTRLSLNISLVSSDITSDKTHPLGAQVLQIGICVLRAEALSIQLERSIAAAKHRLDVDMSKSPIFIDLGPISWAEQEVKQTANCSDLATRPAQANQSQSLLWFCSAQASRSSGHLVIAPTHIGFWSKDLTRCDSRHYISLQSIETVRPFRTAIRHLNGVTIRLSGGMGGLKLAFQCAGLRDEAMRRINDRLTLFRRQETMRQIHSEPLPRGHNMTSLIAPLSRSLATAVRISLPIDVVVRLPKTVNLPPDVLGRRAPLHFVCLTIGSRGDVQPYIALGLGLRQHNHRVTIITHEEYKDWVEDFGLSHRTAGGDPGELMKLSVENKMFSPEFFRKTVQDFRSWLDELLMDAWEACQDADVLLESPSAMAGVHIAEALKIPYIRTFTMPWAKTGEFPHPFLSPFGSTAAFNSTSYTLFDNVLWRSISQQVNKWRKQVLNLDVTEMGHRAQSKLVQIYDFSQAVVPKPLDWGDNIVISGYWFLDNSEVNWNPPSALLEWMEQARRDNKPIVYIGFGSITVPRPNLVTSRIVKAVTQSGVRAIISRGWSKRMAAVKDIQEVEIPPECYFLDKVPHDWLFPRINAAMHHGGAGTTGASLRAGIPTLIKPWFGDQFFWASRIERLGAGLRVNTFHVNDISGALVRATTDQAMKEKAAQVGTRIRSEDGVHTAMYTIYTQLDKQHRNQGKGQASKP
ncbi:hypothetical protein APHAL10511_002595 [Amanita phalloides]|nr:hypothetical protein APHAL10511_002595 [Amanita phalloides]